MTWNYRNGDNKDPVSESCKDKKKKDDVCKAISIEGQICTGENGSQLILKTVLWDRLYYYHLCVVDK